jgi:hypothetical protein
VVLASDAVEAAAVAGAAAAAVELPAAAPALATARLREHVPSHVNTTGQRTRSAPAERPGERLVAAADDARVAARAAGARRALGHLRDEREVRRGGEAAPGDGAGHVLRDLHRDEVGCGAGRRDVARVRACAVLVDLVQRHRDGAVRADSGETRGGSV